MPSSRLYIGTAQSHCPSPQKSAAVMPYQAIDFSTLVGGIGICNHTLDC